MKDFFNILENKPDFKINAKVKLKYNTWNMFSPW